MEHQLQEQVVVEVNHKQEVLLLVEQVVVEVVLQLEIQEQLILVVAVAVVNPGVQVVAQAVQESL